MDGSDTKSDPRVTTHMTNGISATHTTNVISTQKLLVNPTIRVVVVPITPLVTVGVVGAQERYFEPLPDGSPAGERHGCGAQLRMYFPDSWEGKRGGKGQFHAKGRFFLQSKL